jgi:hypothetical protein
VHDADFRFADADGDAGAKTRKSRFAPRLTTVYCTLPRYAAARNAISILTGEPIFLAALRKRAVRLFSPCIPPIYPKLGVCGDDAC